jgi:hypothetical protein
LQVMKMYRHEVYDQLKMEMPFGVTCVRITGG